MAFRVAAAQCKKSAQKGLIGLAGQQLSLKGLAEFQNKKNPDHFSPSFLSQNDDFKTRDFSPLIERVLAGAILSISFIFRAIKFYWRFSKFFKANIFFCRIIKLSLFISLLTEFLLFLLPAQRDRRSPQRRFFTNRYRGKYKYQLDFEISWHTYNSLKMKWLHNAQSLFKNTVLLLRRPTNLPLISNFKKKSHPLL